MAVDTRNRPTEEAAPETAGGPDTTNRIATLDTVPAWPPAEGAAAPPTTIAEVDRRRRAYFELRAFLRDVA